MVNKQFALFLMSSLLWTSCGDDYSEMVSDSQPGGTVRIRAELSGNSDAVLYEVAACRFEEGILKEVLHPVGGTQKEGFLFSPEVRRGELYMLANHSGWRALETLVPGSSREDEMLALTAHVDEMLSNGVLMTGKCVLAQQSTGVLAVKMERSVARIDLYTPEAEVEVRSVSIRGLYGEGYVFPTETVSVPAEADSLRFAKDYGDIPLSNGRDTLLYVPEQSLAEGALVEVEALLSGGLHRLQVRLPRVLARNNVYTVQVRGNGAELSASVLYEGWESGTVSGSEPRPAVSVDVDRSDLGKGVRVSAGLDSVFFPYTGGDWRLLLQTDSESVWSVEGSVPGVSVNATEVAAGLHISGELRRPGTSDDQLWVNVSRKGVHTGKITLIFEGSPILLGGMLRLDENGECDLGRYADGELGTVEVPADKRLWIETAPDEAWMRADVLSEDAEVRRYRILGGWRPNDPTADGRVQEGRLVIADGDGNREEYVVKRRNWGLPVVKMGNTWWTKYNLRGDVRRFEEQITCNEDPAANVDLMGLLESMPEDSLLRLMGDQYQGGIFQGMPLRHDGQHFYHEGMKPSGQNFGLLEPGLMAPDGYQIPDYDDYAWLSASDNQNLGGVGSRSYANRYGEPLHVTVVERDVHFLGHHYGVISFYEFAHEDSRWVLFGLGHQWNNTAGNISRMHLLLATYGNPDQTWVMEGYEAADRPGQNWIKFTPQNHIKTRTIRCVKTPVEYIY